MPSIYVGNSVQTTIFAPLHDLSCNTMIVNLKVKMQLSDWERIDNDEVHSTRQFRHEKKERLVSSIIVPYKHAFQRTQNTENDRL